MRDFSVCGRQDTCVNPKQGRLTKSDFYKKSSVKSGYRFECKKCSSAAQAHARKHGVKPRVERDYSVCLKKENCLNNRQGYLTENDYHLNGSSRRKHFCKICTNAYQKIRRMHNIRSCKNGDECVNENRDNLTDNDFHPGRRICRACSIERAKFQKEPVKSFSVEDVVSSSLVQQWLCGRVGCEVQKQRV